MKLKYVMTRYSPVVFKTVITHSDAAKGLEEITSAGFLTVTVKNGTLVCDPYGESISLGIKSNPVEDKVRLEEMFNNDTLF